MKKIVFLGNSLAGVKVIEEIRKMDRVSDISIISHGQALPYQRHLLSPWLAHEIQEQDLIYRPVDYFKENNIHLLLDKNIVKIDFKKNRLITKEKEAFDFDILVITDPLFHKLPDIKGTQKKGVFGLKDLYESREVTPFLSMVETMTIQTNDISGILLACALRRRKKEVMMVVPADSILSEAIDQGPAQVLIKILDDNAVRAMTGTSITEILGDEEVKAVRLSSGKVFASQAVIFSRTKPDFSLFMNSGLTLNTAIVVDEFFKTNLENVYALDGACVPSRPQSWDDYEISAGHLAGQGLVVGRSILGETSCYAVPSRFVSLNIFGNSLTLIGQTKNHSGWKEYKEFDPPRNMYKKILMENDIVVGAILMNFPDQDQKIKRLIEQRVPVGQANPSEANFLLDI